MPLRDSDIVASDSDSDTIFINHDDISNYNPEQILPESPEDIQKIRAWLHPTSYDIAGGEYRKHLASHVVGTGAWLTSSTTYQEWLHSSEHGMLWIKGIPGSGKSVMAAKLINEIAKSNPGSPVLFFFFRQIIEANHEPEALLRDWMDQVLDYSPPLQKQLKNYVEARRAIDTLSMEDMWRDLHMAFANLAGKVFCVGDALDEMDQGHDEFLKALGALGQWRPEKVKVLITSRPVPSVEAPFRKTPCLHIRLQENLVDLDISTYVHFTLSNSTIPKSNWQVISNAVPGRANGLFLYAKLAMDAFLEPGVDINTVLSRLPADLNVLYTDLLKEHALRSGVAANIQHLILQSVTHATRPLRLLELAEMIKVNSPDGFTRDLKATKDLIRTACGPLLEILADETVSVIHHSFTEYLKGSTRSVDSVGYPILQMGSTHAHLALACLRYLRAGCLDMVEITIKDGDEAEDDWDGFGSYSRDHSTVSKTEVQLRLKHPFFEYAASNWHIHVSKSDTAGHDQAEVNTEIREFLGDSKSMKAWLQIKWPDGASGAGLATQLHIAANAGLVSYTKELLKDMEVDSRDGLGKTPLWWAATEGHAAVIRELTKAGANPDQEETVFGLKPLHNAANGNHHEAVKALLEAGVDPLTPKTHENPGRWCGNAPRSTGQTPLMYACHNGHFEAMEAFLPFIRDIDTVHRALAWSAECGRSTLVARILQHPGVDVNVRVRGDTPLYLACGCSNLETIKTLLQAGADATIDCDDSGDEFSSEMGGICYYGAVVDRPRLNCMHQLCGLGSRLSYGSKSDPEDLPTIFSLLVEAGVDIHQRTSLGSTPLHGALASPVLTRLLLDAGADANVTDTAGSSPLHKVVSRDSMALLIEQGNANIDIARADGQTPLLTMLSTYHTETILKFLEYRPNCNATDNKGNGALHISLQQWSSNPEIIKALLKGGADPNLKNHGGLTPLLSIRNSRRESAGIVDSLLEAGADINAVDRNGATLLFRLLSTSPFGCGKDSHKDLRNLIDRGASTSMLDFKGRTILHEAVKCHSATQTYGGSSEPDASRFNFLIGLGLDAKVVDYSGNGLLHELALRANNHDPHYGPKVISFWDQLVTMGLDLEQKNHAGRTLLHILCAANTDSLRFKQGDTMPIDFVISRSKNFNRVDNDGITALHLAVTGGELYAKKLLDAGADPTKFTQEGLTPLHLASRCRDSNVVGLLLNALRRRSQETQAIDNNSPQPEGSDTLSPRGERAPLKPVIGVDAAAFGTGDSITPLFYACQSGRPESVALLLEAGANVKIGRIFQACANFEAEDALWMTSHDSTDGDANGGAVAVRLEDRSRWKIGRRRDCQRSVELGPHETARLEEILDMLISYGADVSQLNIKGWTGGCIDEAVRANRDYTAACLRSARDKNQTELPNRSNSTTISDHMDVSLKNASVQKVKDSDLVEAGKSNQEMFRRFLVRRDYHLVEELAHLGARFLPLPKDHQICNLAVLVRNGFASLVDKIGTLEAKSALETGDWHVFGDKTKPGLSFANKDLSDPRNSYRNPIPFLLEAVRRKLPNMDVVRLLVEKFGVDIDELHFTQEFVQGENKAVPFDSALHSVARGNSWWHVHQALPYLLKAGADMGIRNYNGQTPVHMALRADGNWAGPFHREAAKILIEAGADVDAVDGMGQSCLACAQHDIDMIKSLKLHGATVTPDAIFAAIDAKNVEALEELLSGGVDANIRRIKPPEEPAGKKEKRGHRFSPISMINDLEPHEEFPLYHAAMSLRLSSKPTSQSRQELEVGFQLVQVLLDRGADPFAKFLRKDKESQNTYDQILTSSITNMPSSDVPEGYEECTTLHELLLDGRPVDSFFRLPELDVNHRDTKGRTLLHAVCQGDNGPDYITGSHRENMNRVENVSVFQRLISLGAELGARDNFGRNVLHCMIDGRRGNNFKDFKDSLADVLIKAPELIDQADGNGQTPLHLAVTRAVATEKPHVAKIILSAGANPFAINKNGDNILHILAQGLDHEILRSFFKELVGRGVGVNTRNTQGETPLFAFYNRAKADATWPHSDYDSEDENFAGKDAILMLKKLDADFFARDGKGRGLLHFAARGDVERFKPLMDLGLDVMLEDGSQQTPIDVAAACGNKEILALFEKKD
ncbi:Fc.00g106140.m01.CDS01 [Cosmosporella sp. VM-42]